MHLIISFYSGVVGFAICHFHMAIESGVYLIMFSLAMLLGFGANRLQASILMWKFI